MNRFSQGATREVEDPPAGSTAGITIAHVTKKYGRKVAVDDISFSIQEGEIFGIIGPNGAGKTTTVECISGLRAPDAGEISVFGLSPRNGIGRDVSGGVGVPTNKRPGRSHRTPYLLRRAL